MRRLERLVNLLAALIDTTKPLSREDLWKRVPGYSDDSAANRRAFERDKETLRAMGIPVVMEPLDPDYPDHGEGYRVPREKYALADPGLTPEEMRALAVAASAVKLKSQAAVAALWKLGTDVDSQLNTPDVAMTDDERLSQLFKACTERRLATFDYRGTSRQLEAHRIAFRNGHWYATGRDLAHDDVRTYRLDRIEGTLELTSAGAFQRTGTSSPWLPAWQMGEDEPRVVQVLIDADHSTLALAQIDSETIVDQRDDGSIVIDFVVTNRDALCSWVLGFLDHAEIIGPADIRDEFISRLKDLVKS